MEPKKHESGDDRFIPRGAITFFFIFVVILILIWGFFYWIMISRL